MSSSRALHAILSLLLCLASSFAQADVLYSTFGPGDTYDSHDMQLVGWGAQLGKGFEDRQVANRFTVAGESLLGSYRVAITHFSIGDPGQGLLSLWSGQTAPSTLIEAAIAFDIGRGVATIAEVASPGQPLLHAGEVYWLVLAAAPPDELFGWHDSDQPLPGDGAVLFRDDIHGWAPGGAQGSAFAILGAPASAPEPASSALVGLALTAALLTALLTARRRSGLGRKRHLRDCC